MQMLSIKKLDNILPALTVGLLPLSAHAQSSSPTFLEENQLAIAIITVFYILPSLISHWRKHPSKGAIIVVNVLLGWTIIGWIVALIWACGSTKQNVVVINGNVDQSNTSGSLGEQNATPASGKTMAEKIAELKALLDSGSITQAEFDVLKRDVMKSLS